MRVTYGSIVAEKGEGMLRPFKITELLGLDVETGDGRLMESAGGGVRSLPRTVFGGFKEGNAHGDNVVIGRLDAVEFDPENHTATGWGWLLDNEDGRKAALYAESGAMRHNSVHLAEIEMEIRWKSDDPNSPDFLEYTLVFTKWKVASTTMLGIPAFAESHFELTAAMIAGVEPSDELIVLDQTALGYVETTFDVKFPEPTREVTASLDPKPKPPWEWFYRAEEADPTPITLGEPDEHGFIPVWGNLARWNVCHDGIDQRCVIAPYDPTEYASFNCGEVLTTRGKVPTGPIFFKGGHPDKPLGDDEAHKAYGGIENAWADVHVTHGQHGPWIAGYVREGVDDKAVIAARASGISGHWAPDGRLKAIVSVNVRGYDVPRSKVFTDEEGNVLEVVASFIPDCGPRGSQDFKDNAYSVVGELFPILDRDAFLNAARILATMEVDEPTASDVDVADEAAVTRYLALLDLEDDAAV